MIAPFPSGESREAVQEWKATTTDLLSTLEPEEVSEAAQDDVVIAFLGVKSLNQRISANLESGTTPSTRVIHTRDELQSALYASLRQSSSDVVA